MFELINKITKQNNITIRQKVWRDTPLEAFVKNLLNTDTELIRDYTLGFMPRGKNIKEIDETFPITDCFINIEFKQHICIENYEWLNSFLASPTTIYNSEAFSEKDFKVAYIKNVSWENAYIQTNDSYIYITFFSKDLSRLFTFYINKTSHYIDISYKYKDKDDKHIDIYETDQCIDRYVFDDKLKKFIFCPAFSKTYLKETITEEENARKNDKVNFIWYIYQHGKTENRQIEIINGKYYFFHYTSINDCQKYERFESDFFFLNLQKILKIKNIQNMQEISDIDFWDISSCLGLSVYVSPSSGEARTLKHKIIIINKLLGYDRFNEEKFTLKKIHYNNIKGDYYFTNKLSLSQVLSFAMITNKEKKYLKNLILSLK